MVEILPENSVQWRTEG